MFGRLLFPLGIEFEMLLHHVTDVELPFRLLASSQTHTAAKVGVIDEYFQPLSQSLRIFWSDEETVHAIVHHVLATYRVASDDRSSCGSIGLVEYITLTASAFLCLSSSDMFVSYEYSIGNSPTQFVITSKF